MDKTDNENITPLIDFNVERVAKVLFAYNNQDDLLYLTEDDFKLLDKDGKLTNKFDENIFVQLAKKGSGDFNDGWTAFFPEEFKDNLKLFMKIANSMHYLNESFLKLASKKILNNKDFAKTIVSNCVKHNGSILKYFSEEIRNNKGIVLIAVANNGNELEYASDKLKKDREVVLTATNTGKSMGSFSNESIKYVDKSFLSDFEIARVAVSSSGNSLQYFADEIRQDKDIVSIAVNNSPSALQFADKSLLSDKDFILSLWDGWSSSFRAFSILGDKLKKDHDIVTKAIAMDCNLYQDLPKNLKEDLLIFTEALKDTSFDSRKLLPLMVENAPSIITQDIDTCKKIISKDLSFFEYLPKNMQSNKEIISFWSKLETKNYSELDEKDLIIFLSFISRDQKSWFRKNKETTAQTLKKINTIEGAKSIVTYLGDLEPDVFQNLDTKLLTNQEVLNAAVNAKPTYTKAPSIMEYIVSNIQEIYNSREYIEKVLRKYGSLMEFLPDNLKNDKGLAEIAIKQDYNSFKHLSKGLKDDDQIIDFLLSVFTENDSSTNFRFEIIELASNRIKENLEIAKKLSNYGYVMKGFITDKDIVVNALKHNPYADFGDIWDFDIAQIAQISTYDLNEDKVKTIVNNKEMMGVQFIMAINSNSRARDIVEETKPYFDRLDYDWITDNNIGVEDEYGYGYDY
tara:strand:+ start:2100 stop:4151 length:2052 start_codon:yes stop_codon:yes gene_type:complete